MKETIRSRIGRILTGTANSIIDTIEGLTPETIMEQAIREVDSAVDEIRDELGTITAQKYHVSKTVTKLNSEHSTIEEQVEEAMKEGRDELVQSALSRQVDIEDQLPSLENQSQSLSEQEKELNDAVTGLLAKRRQMEDELLEFKRNKKAAESAGNISPTGPSGSSNKAEKAENAFSRVLQNETGVRRSDLQTSAEDRKNLAELAKLSKKAKIEAKLQALKQKHSS